MKRSGVLGAAVAGCALEVVAWLAFAPWDLSEVDRSGRRISGGADHAAPRIGLALLVVTVCCGVVAFVWQRFPALAASLAASVAWVVLFVWRSSASRTDGANMWPVALVIIVLPAAALAVGAVAACVAIRARRADDQTRAGSSPVPPFER